MTIELDDLYREAKVAADNESIRTQRSAAFALHEMRNYFSNEKNWTEVGAVNLIKDHEPLGVFREFLHPSGARKLIRDNRLSASRTEEM